MRNLKKFLALVLAMMMTLSLMVTVNAAPARPTDFTDKGNVSSTYVEAVNVLSALKIVQGDNGFRPGDPISRAEVAMLLYRIVTTDVSGKQVDIYKDYNEFTDVAADKWYAGAVNFCANAEMIKGYGNGRFGPSDNVTGYQVLAMVLRAMGYGQNKEFEGSGWQVRTASTAKLQGVLEGINESTLGLPATREVVAQILFNAIQAPTVTYKPYIGYDKDVLVENTDDNRTLHYASYIAAGGTLPIYNNLLLEKFEIVGKDPARLIRDNYGRPSRVWVKDNGTDSILGHNGPKLNPASDGITNKYLDENGTPTDNLADAVIVWYTDASKYVVDSTDTVAIEIPIAATKTYYDVVTECQLAKDVNGDNSIPGSGLTEYLNGALISKRTGYTLDATHTTDTNSVYTVGAPGRATEVYKTGTNEFTFVYVDTLMGVVGDITPRAFDTNDHVMVNATMEIQVNDDVTVTYESDSSDFEEWKTGDLILFTTYGGRNWNPSKTVDAMEGDTSWRSYLSLQKIIPQMEPDFLWDDDVDTSWAVDILTEKPGVETITVEATTGDRNIKNGLISTNKKNYPGNVVYLANESVFANGGYFVSGATYDGTAKQFAGETTVPEDYRVPMINEDIGKTLTAVLDPRGYVVGLTQEAVSTNIGVITNLDTLRVGTGRYVVEADILLMDGTTKTIQMLKNLDTAYNNNTKYDYFDSTELDHAFGLTEGKNCDADKNVLVRIEPYTKDGNTYYKVTATNNGENETFTAAGVTARALGNTTSVMTGVANTLADGATNTDFVYPAAPKSVDTVEDLADNKNYINDNTKFIIAEYDYRYNQGNGQNVGGYTDLTYKTYTGFKNIPTITGAASEILWQKIGNNVFIYPDQTVAEADREYTLKAPATYAVDESYLVLGTVATYADHSTYKVLKDGVETTLDVSNNNGANGGTDVNKVNADVEAAMAAHKLITIASKSSKGYATAVTILDTASDYTFDNMVTNETVRTIAKADVLKFAKDGVLYNDTDATLIGPAATKFLTLAEGCKVVIVNLTNGTWTNGTENSIMQYENYTGSHDFVYELNANGYVSTLYIID